MLADVAFGLALAALHIFDLGIAPHPPGSMWWWPLLVSVPATCSLLLRRRLPWTVLVILLAAAVGLTLADVSIGALNLAILVAIYTICVRSGLLGAVSAASLAMLYPISELPSMPVGDGILRIVGAVVNLVMVVGWGRAMRVGRLRAVQLQQTVKLLDQARDQLAADAAVVERARIAREFHDIVSHNLSVVALRAGVARALVDDNPDHARETLRELEQTSSAALGEMRTMLGALRGDTNGAVGPTVEPGDQEQGHRQPAPGLDQVSGLVDSVRDAGVTWRLERRGKVRELGPGVEMTAYRIVQEAVTNVLKHAGPGHARVLLDYGNAALRVEITNHSASPDTVGNNDGRPADAGRDRTRPTAGHGLIGLRERVALLGGTLTAHPITGGFHLEAVLPCAETSDVS
jgi:signal transduction histidine kinase